MNPRRKLRQEEKRKLQMRAEGIFSLVNKILQQEFNRKIFAMKKIDQYRLLVLDAWRQKYKVSIRFILQILVPYYQSRMQKWQRRRYTDGLGVRVYTLVGNHSEKILQETIAREFPENEHLDEWRWKKRTEIIQSRETADDDGIAVREKTVTDFGRPERYTKYYQEKVKQRRKEFEKEISNDENKRRPYRDNPWL